MDRRLSYLRVILPTSALITEFSTYKTLIEQAQMDLKSTAAYVMSLWANYECEHWQYYNPVNLSTSEMLMSIVCQDLLSNAVIESPEDRRHLTLIIASFVKRFYFEIILTLEAMGLTDSQLRHLEIDDWIHLDMALQIRMQ